VDEELARVLEVIAIDHLAENALRRDGRAIGSHHHGDLALGHNRHGHLVHSVLPAEISEVQSRWQSVGLITGLTGEGDQVTRWKRSRAEFFDDDAHLTLANEHGAEKDR